MTDITLIVPPLAKTATTGFRLAAERKIYGVPWRVEFWHHETYPRIYRDGRQVSIAQCPEYAAKFANAAAAYIPAA